MAFDGVPNFSIIESEDPAGVRIELLGELDISVAGRVRDRLEALSGSGVTVALDLSRLDFIDSSGINVIITYHKQAAEDGWKLLVEPQMTLPVRRVVNVMGLSSVFWPRTSDPEPQGTTRELEGDNRPA